MMKGGEEEEREQGMKQYQMVAIMTVARSSRPEGWNGEIARHLESIVKSVSDG